MSVRNGKYRSFVTPVLPPCFVSSVAKSASPRLSNPQPPRYLDRADTHLGISCREPGVDQLGDLLSREAARKHDRFGAAVWAGGEQFKRPPAVGLGASWRSVGCLGYAGHNVDTAYSQKGTSNNVRFDA